MWVWTCRLVQISNKSVTESSLRRAPCCGRRPSAWSDRLLGPYKIGNCSSPARGREPDRAPAEGGRGPGQGFHSQQAPCRRLPVVGALMSFAGEAAGRAPNGSQSSQARVPGPSSLQEAGQMLSSRGLLIPICTMGTSSLCSRRFLSLPQPVPRARQRGAEVTLGPQ